MAKLLFAVIALQSFFTITGGIAGLGNVGFHSTKIPPTLTVSIPLLYVF